MNKLLRSFALLLLCVSMGTASFGQGNTTITFELVDSFGDGWNGTNILVTGTTVDASATGVCPETLVPTPFSKAVGADFTTGSGPFIVECDVELGSTVEMEFVPVGFPGETSYTVLDADGTVILTGAAGTGLPFTYVASVPTMACIPNGALPALEVSGSDSFGDGWNGASIDVEYFDASGAAISTTQFGTGNFGGSFAEIEAVTPAGATSAVVSWSASCGGFPGEITNWSVTYNPPGGAEFDPVTGLCISTGGATQSAAGTGCVAGQTILTLALSSDVTPAVVIPCITDDVILAEGDCLPSIEFCAGLLAQPDLGWGAQVCPGFTSDPQGLDVESVQVDCNGLYDVSGDVITISSPNEMAVSTACDDITCPGAVSTSGVALTTVPVTVPDGYTSLVVDYELTPDCTGNFGEDQFSYYITDANGVIQSFTFLVNFGASGVITGTETVDLTGIPAGAKIGFYMLTNTGLGVDGSATAVMTGTFIDETGSDLLVTATNEEGGCDQDLDVLVDFATGTVSIGLIPGQNDICISFWDGCNLQVCDESIFVDDSAIERALACNDHINVSVDGNCEVLINADMVLEGGDYLCDTEYIIEITTTGGVPVSNPVMYDPEYAPNNEYIVSVYDPYTCNSCWGTMTLEDKIAPELECDCPPGSVTVNPDGSFSGPAACIIECHDVDRYLEGKRGGADPIDNCGGWDVQFTGAQIDDVGDCTYKITQTWGLVGPGYNSGDPITEVCISEYYVEAPSLDDVECPDDVTYECDEVDTPHLTHPDETGYPTLWNQDIYSGNIDTYCNIFASYDDVDLPACGPDCYGPTKILRTWTILDWCSGDVATCTQVIKIIDTTDPTIDADDIVVSTDPWVCTADVWFDDPHMHDNCTYDLDWEIAWSNSGALLVDDEGRPITQNNHGPIKHAMGVPKGDWTFVLKTADCCGNIGYDTIAVNVLDKVAPVAVATQNITISLTGAYPNATAKLLKESVNNGSHDNCTDVWTEIRRDTDPCGFDGNTTYSNVIPEFCDPWYDDDDHDYGEYVKFCCEDAMADGDGDGEVDGLVKVWMRVWDDGNCDNEYASFTYYDNPGNDHDYCEFNDNYNETWVWVKVEDKAPQSIICPPDVTIPCHWDYNDLTITGEAYASEACGHPHVAHVDWPEIHCGEGYVLREWFIDTNNNGEMDSDEGEYPCVQFITIEYVDSPLEVVCPDADDFDGVSGNPDITWEDPFNPTHIAVDCDDFEFPEPWQSGGKCNLIGVSSTIDTFWFEEDACFKAVKYWTYVDWCTNDSFECSFTVSVIDTDAPTVTAQDTCFAVDDYWDADGDWNYCELASDVDVCAVGDDMGDCPSEWIKWVINVDLWYDGNVELVYSSFLPHSDPFYVAPTPRGEKVTIELDKDDISAEWARHFIEYKAFDGCGNTASTHQYVEVADKKAPTPYCVGISTALMSPEAGNLVELWAKDFNLGSFDNCTPEHWLRYTFNEVPPVLDLIEEDHCFEPVWDDQDNCIPARDANGIIMSEEVNNCNGYENGAQNPMCPVDGIQKWMPNGVDADGNPCKTSGMKFVGTDWCGENEIRISVWDKKFNMDFCWVTLVIHGVECGGDAVPRDISGIILTEAGQPVELAQVTNTGAMVTGGQMTTMTTNTGIYAFEDQVELGDYAITAARNNDYLNGVSTLDLVLIQKHILGLTALNSGFKVVAADINNDETISAVDLVELRKLILGIYTELPNNDSWRFVDADQTLNVSNPWPINEEVNISVLSEDMMSEDFVGIKVGDVNGNVIASANSTAIDSRSNTNLELITETLNGSVVVKAGNNFSDVYGYQFTMNVAGNVTGVAKGALNLTEANFGILGNGIVTTSFASETAITVAEGDVLFTLNGASDITLVDGYTTAEAYQGATLDIINVSLRDGEGTTEFSLAQNEPNPFSANTSIAFTLGQSGIATLTVYEVTGKVLKVIEAEYEAGNHSINISKNEIGASGVLYYQLESGNYTATKKMIVLD